MKQTRMHGELVALLAKYISGTCGCERVESRRICFVEKAQYVKNADRVIRILAFR